MLKQFKKFKRLILTSALKPKAFLILFALFFSSLAYASTLSVTWEAGIIPGGNKHFKLGINYHRCTSSTNGAELELDRTEHPSDVAFSEDGLTVFTANKLKGPLGNNEVSQNRLDRPFDIMSDRVRFNPEANCDDLDGLALNTLSGGGLNGKGRSIDVVNDLSLIHI